MTHFGFNSTSRLTVVPATPPHPSGNVPSEPNTRSATSADASVGLRIKQFRRAAGHTQKHVARIVGVTGAQLHRYETGATRVATSRLIAIASALQVRPETLMSDALPERARAPAVEAGGLGTDGLVELVELYSSLRDPRRRNALIGFARTIARPEPTFAQAAE